MHGRAQVRPPLVSPAGAPKEAAPQPAPAPSQQPLPPPAEAGGPSSLASILYAAPATPLSSHPISAPPVCMPLYSWQMQREWAAQLQGRVPDEVDALMERGLPGMESISSASPAQPGSPAPGTPAPPPQVRLPAS